MRTRGRGLILVTFCGRPLWMSSDSNSKRSHTQTKNIQQNIWKHFPRVSHRVMTHGALKMAS